MRNGLEGRNRENVEGKEDGRNDNKYSVTTTATAEQRVVAYNS